MNNKKESTPEDFGGPDQGAFETGEENLTDEEDYTISGERAIEIIREFAGQRNTITFSRAFFKLTGDIPSALLLSELVFWTGKGAKEEGWIWKTDREIQDELCLSRYQCRKARKDLESQGLIENKIKKAFGNPTVHYRIIECNLSKSLVCLNTANGKYKNCTNESANPAKRKCESSQSYNSPNNNPNTTTTTDRTRSSCFPEISKSNCEALCRDVMEFQRVSGTIIKNEDKYLFRLKALAAAGKLAIPVGYAPKADREKVETERVKREEERRAKAVKEEKQLLHDRLLQEEMINKFRRLSRHEQDKYVAAAREELGAAAEILPLVRIRAAQMAGGGGYRTEQIQNSRIGAARKRQKRTAEIYKRKTLDPW